MDQIRLWSSYSDTHRESIMSGIKKPEVPPRNRNKEHKPKPQEDPMAKPNGITRRGEKFKVTLDTHGKRVYIGTYKTLEEAEAALEDAKKHSGDT